LNIRNIDKLIYFPGGGTTMSNIRTTLAAFSRIYSREGISTHYS